MIGFYQELLRKNGMKSSNDWIDQLVDLIIDCFLWEWRSGRLAKGEQDSYIKNNPKGDRHEGNNGN